MEFRDLLPIFKNRNNLVNIGLVVLALILAKNIYARQAKGTQELKSKQQTELNKAQVITEITQTERKITLYKNALYQRDVSSVINSITQIASAAQISIVSIRPEREREFGAYNKITLNLSIDAKDYHRIGNFVSRLENAADPYMTIDSISIRHRGERGAEPERLSATLVISVVIFKG